MTARTLRSVRLFVRWIWPAWACASAAILLGMLADSEALPLLVRVPLGLLGIPFAVAAPILFLESLP